MRTTTIADIMSAAQAAPACAGVCILSVNEKQQIICRKEKNVDPRAYPFSPQVISAASLAVARLNFVCDAEQKCEANKK